MNFNEICLDAELTRDEIYGLDVGNGETIFCTKENNALKQQESEHRKIKKIKAENVENYRKQLATSHVFDYNGHTDEIALHTSQQTFVGAMVKAGIIEFDDKF